MTRTARIIVVDDDVEDQMILKEYFTDLNLQGEAHFLFHGVEALEYLNRAEELPKVIVLDLNMPIMNGIQTLQEIKTTPKLKSIPVIIYSTSQNETEKRKALSLGAVDYLVKPMTYEEGQRTVKRFAEFL